MTQDDLDELHEIWRKRLHMGHMKGEMKLVRRVDKKGSLGNCSSEYGVNYYAIEILEPSSLPIEEGEDRDIETVVVHELLHARRWWEFSEDDKVKTALYEREIHENSLMLVEAWRATE